MHSCVTNSIKAKLLESRVDKMMAEMNSVTKMMVSTSNQDSFVSDEDDQFEDPIEDFDIDTPRVCILFTVVRG